jgi:hypothetical protein
MANKKGQQWVRCASGASKQSVLKGNLIELKIGARFSCHGDTRNLSKGQTDLSFRWILQAHSKIRLGEGVWGRGYTTIPSPRAVVPTSLTLLLQGRPVLLGSTKQTLARVTETGRSGDHQQKKPTTTRNTAYRNPFAQSGCSDVSDFVVVEVQLQERLVFLFGHKSKNQVELPRGARR